MVNLDLQQRQLCDIQGRLFELSLEKGYDSPAFIETFMNSHVAEALDDTYDRIQWAGEEYIIEELNDEADGLKKSDVRYSREVLYWAGYLYRFWHYYTGESSKEIYEMANALDINRCWLGFHTLDVEMAVDNFKEIYSQKK